MQKKNVLTLYFLFVITLAFAQVQQRNYRDTTTVPDTPASVHVNPLIEALNSQDRGTLREFIKGHFGKEFYNMHSLDVHANQLERWANNAGKLENHGVRIFDDKIPKDQITVIVKAAKEVKWRALTIYIEKDGGIGGFDYDKIPEPKNN